MMNPIQVLYDAEINYEISCFWDSGFKWRLGDSKNGYKAEGYAKNFYLAASALWSAAEVHYPDAKLKEKVDEMIDSLLGSIEDARNELRTH